MLTRNANNHLELKLLVVGLEKFILLGTMSVRKADSVNILLQWSHSETMPFSLETTVGIEVCLLTVYMTIGHGQ